MCDDTFRERFAINDGWAVLLGSHHRLLIPKDTKSSIWISDGILDLSALAQTTSYVLNPEYLQSSQSRFLFVRIDRAYLHYTISKGLEPYLGKHEPTELSAPAFDKTTGICMFPYDPQKDPPVNDPGAWLKYFQCYDLRERPGKLLSHGDVGRLVYGAPAGRSERSVKKRQSLYDHVKRACTKVKRLMHCAVEGPWPPTRL